MKQKKQASAKKTPLKKSVAKKKPNVKKATKTQKTLKPKTESKHLEADVIIVGGGLAGLTLAAVLGEAGMDVIVVDKEKPVTQLAETFDARTTALSYASYKVLQAAGAWEALEPYCEPMMDIRVADGGSPLFLHFSAEGDGNGEPFGWNLENLPLRKVLYENVVRLKKQVRHIAPAEIKEFLHTKSSVGVVLKDGRRVTAPLLVGADGRQSQVRDHLGITVRKLDYHQTAIVCNITHAIDHENVAVEHFLPAGPFAVLPLNKTKKGHFRSSVVWSVHGGDVQEVLAWPEKKFVAELERLSGNQLGRITLQSKPRGYPLILQIAKKYTGERIALMAEAAHAIHPIAGQGLNLSMRDIALLAEQVIDRYQAGLDIGAPMVLKKYDRLRRLDTHLMAGFTDVLNRLFSNNLKSVALIRDVGLGIVQKLPPAKAFFARQAMGLGGSPRRIVKNGKI